MIYLRAGKHDLNRIEFIKLRIYGVKYISEYDVALGLYLLSIRVENIGKDLLHIFVGKFIELIENSIKCSSKRIFGFGIL